MSFPGLTLILMGALPLMAQEAGRLTVKQVAQRVLPSTVKFFMFDPDGKPAGTGSGFVVGANGIVVTNHHVIAPAYSAKVQMANGDMADVLGVIEADALRDFAIVKIQAVELPTVPFANSDQLSEGDEVIALGAPRGLSGSVSNGIISRWENRGQYRFLQHTSPISPGSSGGPLVNYRAEVVGVNVELLQAANSVFYAVPINYIRASIANSDGKIIPLARYAALVAEAKQKQQAAAFQDIVQKHFVTYRDPAGLFQMLAPKATRTERTEFTNDENGGTRHVITAFVFPNAEKGSIRGWISDGIRVHLRFPTKGDSWGTSGMRRWTDHQFTETARGYRNVKTEKREPYKLGELSGERQVFVGESDQLSKPELLILHASATDRCLATIELVSPADEADNLNIIFKVMHAFKPGW
ncbi:MAG: serine protease [Bryobacterales bacterium]|nr:serine protease [Bryobacterales bacterium]